MTRRRTETPNVSFEGGIANGWAFEIPEAFRDQLDIKYQQFVDREASRVLRDKHPKGEDGKPVTVYRMAWSQSAPPMLSFDVGHVFYDPPGGVVWYGEKH